MENNNDIGRIISIVSNQIKRQFDATNQSIAITGVQGRLLHFILLQSTERDLFQKDVEDEFNLRRSTATGILKLMEKNGLLYRESVDYDARLKKIVVTEKGLRMKAQAVESIRILEDKISRNISTEDLNTFYSVMKQMSKNLD